MNFNQNRFEQMDIIAETMHQLKLEQMEEKEKLIELMTQEANETQSGKIDINKFYTLVDQIQEIEEMQKET